MQIEFDTNERDKALAERGLDFARVAEVFAGLTLMHRLTGSTPANTAS